MLLVERGRHRRLTQAFVVMALSTASTIASDGQSPGACLRACADVLAAFDRKKSLERDMEKMIAGSLTVGEVRVYLILCRRTQCITKGGC